jgi:predicted RNase H-like HicB family nuclease
VQIVALHYSMFIQWSERNQAFLVNVPELPGCKTHGDTYEEAIKNAQEVIELWIEGAHAHGEAVPPPRIAVA